MTHSITNSVQLIGNLGRDPQIVEFDNGTKVARVPMATHSSFTNRDGDEIRQTQWHQLVAWNGRADYLRRFLRKGSFVGIKGKIRKRSYDAPDGVQRQITEVIVHEFMKFNPRESLSFT